MFKWVVVNCYIHIAIGLEFVRNFVLTSFIDKLTTILSSLSDFIISSRFVGFSATRTISSANLGWFRFTPSFLSPKPL